MSCQIIHNDQVIELEDIIAYIDSLNSTDMEEWEQEVFSFLKSWLSNTATYQIPTSGSSGNPKLINVRRADMELSAKMTLDYLNIQKGDKALLCLPVKYIAGKMMVVRSFVGGLKLYLRNPSKNPLLKLKTDADFVAITPYQLNHILKNPDSLQKLKEIRNVIVGGGAVNPSLHKVLRDWKNNLYATFGMTETLSHIAMSEINSERESLFHLINDRFSISMNDKGCLRINTPYSHLPQLDTNDLVEINDKKSFYWLGRVDNVINSGGIKFIPEQLENKVRMEINDPFIITSIDDPELGEKLVLLIESDNSDYYESETFITKMEQCFDKNFEIPKEVFILPRLKYTNNDKIDRNRSKKLMA